MVGFEQMIEDRRELERKLRLEVLGTWDEFASAKRRSGNDITNDRAAALEGEAFWRYQRALQRWNDLVTSEES